MSIRRTEPNREYTGIAGIEGRIRHKLEMGHALDEEERRYFATMRGAREIKGDELSDAHRVEHQ